MEKFAFAIKYVNCGVVCPAERFHGLLCGNVGRWKLELYPSLISLPEE